MDVKYKNECDHIGQANKCRHKDNFEEPCKFYEKYCPFLKDCVEEKLEL